VSEINNDILKKYGEGTLINAKQVLERCKVNRIVPICPAIDQITGGVPQGSWITISGKAKCGKTTTMLHFAANAQKAGMEVYYLDIEGRLKEMNISSIPHLNLETMNIICSTEDKILSAQDYLTIAEQLLLSKKEIVVILDSYSNLVDAKEQESGIEVGRQGGPKLLAAFCRQMGNVVPVKRSIVVGVVHLMANTSGKGAPIVEKGGNAVTYQVDIKLRCKKSDDWKKGEKLIGQQVHWEEECNALGLPPWQECVSYMRYGKGIDEEGELVYLAKSYGMITEKKAGWQAFQFVKDAGLAEEPPNVQGDDNASELLRNNPKWIEYLKQEVKSYR
jgi:RecA/RadA recombinase